MYAISSCLYHKFAKIQLQSLSFSFGQNVLVNLGLNLLIAFTIPKITNDMKPQSIIPDFIYSLKKGSMQKLVMPGFTKICTTPRALGVVHMCATHDSHLDALTSSSSNFCKEDLPSDTPQHPHVHLSWPQSALSLSKSLWRKFLAHNSTSLLKRQKFLHPRSQLWLITVIISPSVILLAPSITPI